MIDDLNPLLVDEAVRRALQEDLGRAGDITTQATVPAGQTAELAIVARRPGRISGLPLARAAFVTLDPTVTFTASCADGDAVEPGTVIARVAGPARAILSAERVALNFLGRMSGIASTCRSRNGGVDPPAALRPRSSGCASMIQSAMASGSAVNAGPPSARRQESLASTGVASRLPDTPANPMAICIRPIARCRPSAATSRAMTEMNAG